MAKEEIDIETAVETLNSDYADELLVIACKALSASGNNRGDHYSPTRIFYDLLESYAFPGIQDDLINDYRRK